MPTLILSLEHLFHAFPQRKRGTKTRGTWSLLPPVLPTGGTSVTLGTSHTVETNAIKGMPQRAPHSGGMRGNYIYVYRLQRMILVSILLNSRTARNEKYNNFGFA
jgi:hypothetical protein